MMAANQTVRAWHSPNLSRHDKLLELLETYHKVRLDTSASMEDYGDKLTWCLEHCQGKFRDLKHSDGFDWYFEKEQDAALFALKWS